ncbi:EVE domain-containing protein [Streptomyces marokkonensis]|uniref:EVE domain-containing protein n=1 Tax=Streptomyces marokkonensis TaxID=324855 RepID=A0ABW6Q1L2_9ACTN
MRDWLFIVNPTDTTMDSDYSSKERVLKLARTVPRRDWWLARRRHMAPGDRIWIYFATPVKEVAAVADVVGEPYEVTGDAEYPWRFPAVLNLVATRALYRSPVPLSSLANQHPQGVPLVRDSDLALFLAHAKL